MGRHDKLRAAVSDYHLNCCNLSDDYEPNNASAEFASFYSENDLQGFVERLYKNAYKDGSFDKKRVNAYAKVFANGVVEGYGKSASNIDFDSPDENMLQALKDNVFHFSAAKNRAEIISLSAALRDPNGKLRSFTDFKLEASKIVDDYQGAWLQTEYDTAVNSAELAARWVEFDDDDILVFRTVGDNRVRDAHKLLDGIAKPKTDPFWNTYYPPLAWNCRCTVETTNSGRITPNSDIPAGAIDGVPPIFRTNFAKEGMAFPKSHPYFKEMTKRADEQIESIGSSEKHLLSAFENGGKVLASKLVDKSGGDYQAVLDCCNHFAAMGKTAEILPKLHYNDVLYNEFFGDLIGTKFERKCPDFKVDNEYFEHEGFTTLNAKRAIRNMLNRGLEQSDNIVIEETNLPDNAVVRSIHNRIRDGAAIREVWIKGGKKLRRIFHKAKA